MARVLVVDDEAAIRAMLRAALEADGHDVVEAPNGLQVDALMVQFGCDLVIVDIFMPFKDGIETILGLRRTRRPVKIIAMCDRSARFGVNLLDAARHLGADATVEKPFDTAALRAAVDYVLSS